MTDPGKNNNQEKDNVKETEIDIHHRDLRLRSAYRLLEESPTCKENKTLIKEFVRHKKISQHIGSLRESKSLNTLRLLAEIWARPLSELKPDKRDEAGINTSRKKLISLLDKAYNRDIILRNVPKKKPSDNTKKDYYIHLKMLYRFMVDRKEPEEFGEWIQIPKPQTNKPTVQELLTPKDIHDLAKAAENERDALLPVMLFHTGGRIESIASLRLRDISPINGGEYYSISFTKVKGNSEGEDAKHTIIMTEGIGNLVEWIYRKHPMRSDQSWPVFCHLKGEHQAMDYSAIYEVMKDLKRKSGVKKKVNPHFFRKSATSWLRNVRKMNDASLKIRHSWNPSSRMLDVYASESEEEANKDYLRALGKAQEEKKEGEEITQVCRVCGFTQNPIGSDVCLGCKRKLHESPEEIKHAIDRKNDMRQIAIEAVKEYLGGSMNIPKEAGK